VYVQLRNLQEDFTLLNHVEFPIPVTVDTGTGKATIGTGDILTSFDLADQVCFLQTRSRRVLRWNNADRFQNNVCICITSQQRQMYFTIAALELHSSFTKMVC